MNYLFLSFSQGKNKVKMQMLVFLFLSLLSSLSANPKYWNRYDENNWKTKAALKTRQWNWSSIWYHHHYFRKELASVYIPLAILFSCLPECLVLLLLTKIMVEYHFLFQHKSILIQKICSFFQNTYFKSKIDRTRRLIEEAMQNKW